MKILLNIIWFVFGGLELAIGYLIAAFFCFIFIVTIPFGIQSLKLASYTLWPFGRALVPVADRRKGLSAVGNVIWFVVGGVWMAIGHLLAAFVCAITIIGIPLAVAHVKIAGAALAPFGKEVVNASDTRARGSDAVVVEAGRG